MIAALLKVTRPGAMYTFVLLVGTSAAIVLASTSAAEVLQP